MARSFILLNLLKEANSIDACTSRRQAQDIRRLNNFNTNRDYVGLYRLSEEIIESLLLEIKELLQPPKFGRSLTTKVKLLCTLSFLASGTYQRVVGRDVNCFISQPSASRCIREIAGILCHPTLVQKYIRFPQTQQERQILKERFYEQFKIPGVIGCINGTFVAMVRPSENEERYYCRKGNHARNILLITDADLNILHVDPTYGVATHDSFVFNNSVIKNHLEELTNNDENIYLLGDSGYAQRPYLMTPVPNAEENTPEGLYNKMHATARNSVERTIGLAKGRFRCMLVHRVLHYDPDMVAKVVVACCVLHNICNRAGLPAPVVTRQDEVSEANFRSTARARAHGSTAAGSQNDIVIGQACRQDLINNLWRARNI